MERKREEVAKAGGSEKELARLDLGLSRKREAIKATQDLIEKMKAEPGKGLKPEQPKVHLIDEMLKRFQAKGIEVLDDTVFWDSEEKSRAAFIEKLQRLESETGIDGAKFLSSFEHMPGSTGTIRMMSDSNRSFATRFTSGCDTEVCRKFEKGEDGKWFVKNDLFFLDDQFQGQGIGKKVLRDQFESYQGSKIDRVEVHAGLDAGAYTWGRFGFTPRDKEQYKVISERLGRLSRNNKDAIGEKLAKRIRDPQTFREFVDSEKGKSYLPGLHWEGAFHFNDKPSVDRFNAYTGASLKVKE
jgi:GNAT superfamily N-acetyltransferase